jgi:hypothetical protein
MEKKWFFVFFSFLILIPSFHYLKNDIWNFYLFRLDATHTASGVILKADYQVGIEVTFYSCQFQYNIKGASYRISENISINDTVTKFSVGQIVPVTYNIKRPWRGTIDTGYDLIIGFLAAVIVFGWVSWSIFILMLAAVKLLKKR